MKKPYKPCAKMGCPQLTRERYCESHTSHQAEEVREYRRNEKKRDHKAFYDSKEWKAARRQAIIRDHGLCVHCLADDRYTPMDVVDHIVELKDDYSLRVMLSNLQCLCHPCHNTKTQAEKRKRNKTDKTN